MSETRQTITEEQFCEEVGICRQTASRLRRQGRLGYCRLGRKILYLRKHVDEFLASLEQPVAPERKRARR